MNNEDDISNITRERGSRLPDHSSCLKPDPASALLHSLLCTQPSALYSEDNVINIVRERGREMSDPSICNHLGLTSRLLPSLTM